MEDVTTIEKNSNPVTPVKPKQKKLSFGRKMLLVLLLLFILAATFKILFGSVFVFSDGDRTGYIYKFSKKGYVFKTHEGILKTGFVNLGNSVTPNEEWKFSVADEEVAKQIRGMDQRAMVKLFYKEYYTRLFWRGDTKYFVYKVEILPNR
jgi:hypothetical protein